MSNTPPPEEIPDQAAVAPPAAAPLSREEEVELELEQIHGGSRFVTLVTIIVHFIHPLLCVANYLDFVRYQNDLLGRPAVVCYMALTFIACGSYFLVVSTFYLWAWRYPEPEESSKGRRLTGVFINLITSDLPILFLEIDMLWTMGSFAVPVQGFCFFGSLISSLYSVVRIWTYYMVRTWSLSVPLSDAPRPHGGGWNSIRDRVRRGMSDNFSPQGRGDDADEEEEEEEWE